MQAYDNNKSVYIFKRLFRISIDVKRRRFQRFIQHNISSMLQPALLRAVPLSCLWLTWPGFTVNTSVSGVLPRSLLFFVDAEKEGGGVSSLGFQACHRNATLSSTRLLCSSIIMALTAKVILLAAPRRQNGKEKETHEFFILSLRYFLLNPLSMLFFFLLLKKDSNQNRITMWTFLLFF